MSSSDTARILSHGIRVELLPHLKSDPPLFTDELAKRILERRRGVNEGELIVEEDEIDSLVIHLRHQHLPLLDEMGVIEYQPTTQTIYAVDDERVAELCQHIQ